MTSAQHGHGDDLTRNDIEALGATRAELGKDYEDALLDSFADRVERTIDQRVAGELARRGGQGPYGMSQGHQAYGLSTHGQPQASTGNGMQLALGIVSTVALIPLAIVLGVTGNIFALLIVVATILGVNVAHAWHYRNQGPRGR